ncbi:hypothetical protein SMKI_13G0860 [Saccharomyces mikatae IFO 1815]|uniref:Pheromone-regulated membrane protein 6 n=1 Tax=Saccharomyces mikatae IFO 1815 TaxID=226126 RepID=A0AA35IR92_SACMI|nr:uncharacterized protein SMKI_13G0860 [Saccharomyces mikatae IFO 1815]CAI4035438.1 hypothetical protein SMKI_13G0860 [Saccharomyces mikatae IFO 1815]
MELISQKLKFQDIDMDLIPTAKWSTKIQYILYTWCQSVLHVAMFSSDIYTCVKLLAFNTWSNNIIQPFLAFRISKWLFSGCILCSSLILIVELIIGLKVFKKKEITPNYMNGVSRLMNCLFNFRKYQIFELIVLKDEKKFGKWLFFSYFEISGCLKLLLGDSPRQIINGLTLWSVLLTVSNETSSKANSTQNLGNLDNLNGIINKIKHIAKTNYEESVILSFMLFSFIIWVILISKLILSIVIFIVFIHPRFLSNEKKVKGYELRLRKYVSKVIDDNLSKTVCELGILRDEEEETIIYDDNEMKKSLDYDNLSCSDQGTIPSYYCYSDGEAFERVYTPIKAYFPQKYKYKCMRM